MRIGASLLGLGLLLAASATEARELELYLENRIGGDSNVFRREQSSAPGAASVKSGGVYEVTPRVTLRDEGDELEYRFAYQPTYEQFFLLEGNNSVGNVSGLDHSGFADLTWRVSPATSMSLNGAFFRQRRVREEIAGVGTSARTLEANDSNYVQRGRGGVDVQHSLDAKTFVTAGYGFDSLDLSESEQSDTTSHRGSFGINYALGPRTQVGFSFNLRERNTKASVQASGGGPFTEFRSNTRTYDLSFSLSRAMTEHWDISLAVGPSIFRTLDENSASSGSTTSDDQTIFARARSEYRMKKGQFDCGYVRSESGGGGGAAASSIYDDVNCKATWRPGRGWSLSVDGGWNRRHSIASDFLLGLTTRIDRVWASGSITHWLSDRLSVIGTLRWAQQSEDQFRVFPFRNRTVSRDFVLGRVALRYTFDPYVF